MKDLILISALIVLIGDVVLMGFVIIGKKKFGLMRKLNSILSLVWIMLLVIGILI